MQKIVQNGANQSEYLYGLLARVQERPGMYLGKPSITRLKMLLMGYGMARRELGLEMTEQEKEFQGFQSWIQERFQVTSTQGWDGIILFHSIDERDALEKFFVLFEKFSGGEGAAREAEIKF